MYSAFRIILFFVFSTSVVFAEEGAGDCVTKRLQQLLDEITSLENRVTEIDKNIEQQVSLREQTKKRIESLWEEFRSGEITAKSEKENKALARKELGLIEDEKILKYEDELKEYGAKIAANSEVVSSRIPVFHDFTELRAAFSSFIDRTDYFYKILYQTAKKASTYSDLKTVVSNDGYHDWISKNSMQSVVSFLNPWDLNQSAALSRIKKYGNLRNDQDAKHVLQLLKSMRETNYQELEILFHSLLMNSRDKILQFDSYLKFYSPVYVAESIQPRKYAPVEELIHRSGGDKQYFFESRVNDLISVDHSKKSVSQRVSFEIECETNLEKLTLRELEYMEEKGLFSAQNRILHQDLKLRLLARWTELRTVSLGLASKDKARVQSALKLVDQLNLAMNIDPETYLYLPKDKINKSDFLRNAIVGLSTENVSYGIRSLKNDRQIYRVQFRATFEKALELSPDEFVSLNLPPYKDLDRNLRFAFSDDSNEVFNLLVRYKNHAQKSAVFKKHPEKIMWIAEIASYYNKMQFPGNKENFDKLIKEIRALAKLQ